PLTSEQSKISSEAIKQQDIETVGKLGEKLQQVVLQKLKENSQQAKDIANCIKQVAEFLSNFRSSDTESGQVSKEITPKAEANVYGYANVKNED
ncbi:TIGR03546 family protein, partial [Francisella tularensis subsp. holarctica]|nr:TIGR03546 family protein [Francisella tularensis subsp. holarctica]